MSFAGLHYFRYQMISQGDRKVGTLRLGATTVYSVDVTHIVDDEEAEAVVINTFAESLTEAISKLTI